MRRYTEVQKAHRTAKISGSYPLASYNNNVPLFIPPSLVAIESSRVMNIDTMRHGRIAQTEFVQTLFLKAEALVNRLVMSVPLSQDTLPYDDNVWGTEDNVPCFSVYKDNQPRRLPVVLGLKRRDLHADCVGMLHRTLVEAGFSVDSSVYRLVLCTFGDACTDQEGREVARREFVLEGCWIPPYVKYDTPEDPHTSILWTCVTRVAILERLALRTDHPQLAFSAHACLQMHCPLACYLQDRPNACTELNSNPRLYSSLYPTTSKVCWAPRGWDMSFLMHECGFFTKQPVKVSGNRRKKAVKKPDMADMASITEQINAGYAVLEDIFRKSLPFKCAIRGLVYRIREECKTDRSIGDLLVELFHCSMLGGYPEAKYRPSFTGLMHLYNAFFIKPKSLEDILSWFHKDRGDKTNDFVFDDTKPFRHVWDGHPGTPEVTNAWKTNNSKKWSVEAVQRDVDEEKRRNTPISAYVHGKGQAVPKQKRAKESRNYQRLFMLTFQEMLVHNLASAPALYMAIRKPCEWDKVAANVTTQMDLVRRCVDSALRMKHINAGHMYKPGILPFAEAFIKAWPEDVFLATYNIVQSREFSVVQWEKSPLSFEAEVMSETAKIDTERRAIIETYNARNKVPINDHIKREAMRWGKLNPHNLGQAMYVCDFLENVFPPFVKQLHAARKMLDMVLVPIESPMAEIFLAPTGIHVWVIEEMFRIRKAGEMESDRNSRLAGHGTQELSTLLRSLSPDEYTFIRFFYMYAQRRRALQVYRLSQEVVEKQKIAVARKFKLSTTAELKPSMTETFICPCCNMLKASLSSADQHNVTAFGNPLAAVDPLTMKVYCAKKIKKPNKSRRNNDHKEISSDIMRAEVSTHDEVELDNETRKKHKRMFTCHSKSLQKTMTQAECNVTELIKINLLGSIVVFNDLNYTICPSCGSPMQLTRNCFKGDMFGCGSCGKIADVLYSAVCAFCKAAYLPDQETNPIVSRESKLATMRKVVEAHRTPGVFPEYNKTWVRMSIVDDSSEKEVPPPFMCGDYGRELIKNISLCPQHDQAWLLFDERKQPPWSDVHDKLNKEYCSFYMESLKTFIAYKRNAQRVNEIRMGRLAVAANLL